MASDRSLDAAAPAWVAPSATAVGAVTMGAGTSVWYGAVLRADLDRIELAGDVNVQDAAVLHADPAHPVTVHDGVSIGHGAVLHGCTVEGDVLIGMNSVVLNGATIGAGSIIAAGAVVLEGTAVPPRSLVAGMPGRVKRQVSDAELDAIRKNAATYRALAARHAAGEFADRAADLDGGWVRVRAQAR